MHLVVLHTKDYYMLCPHEGLAKLGGAFGDSLQAALIGGTGTRLQKRKARQGWAEPLPDSQLSDVTHLVSVNLSTKRNSTH